MKAETWAVYRPDGGIDRAGLTEDQAKTRAHYRNVTIGDIECMNHDDLIAWLTQNDRDGCYTREDCAAEGCGFMSEDQARDMVLCQLAIETMEGLRYHVMEADGDSLLHGIGAPEAHALASRFVGARVFLLPGMIPVRGVAFDALERGIPLPPPPPVRTPDGLYGTVNDIYTEYDEGRATLAETMTAMDAAAREHLGGA